MKKITGLMAVVMLAVMLAACGGSKKDGRVLGDIIQVYADNDIEVDENDKPYFQMIGAKDGVIFYIDTSVVKIYEYESEKSLSEAQETYKDVVKDWPVNGKFLLETSSEKAIEIFNGIEQP